MRRATLAEMRALHAIGAVGGAGVVEQQRRSADSDFVTRWFWVRIYHCECTAVGLEWWANVVEGLLDNTLSQAWSC